MMELVKNPTVIWSYVVALILTGGTYYAGMELGWITEVNWLEVFAVFTSYSCTFLCVKQSRLNYPIGAISVVAYSLLFFLGGLYSSAFLNVYLIGALLWGWFRWGPDTDTRPVSRLDFKSPWMIAYIGGTLAIYACLLYGTWMLGASLPAADSAILIGSILAQFLLDNKKLENWYVWAGINVLAIYTYSNAGLALVAFQYVFFLANTIYGYVSWKRSMSGSALASVK
jgi:nicotinamide mononucleotide transporter